MQELLEGHSIIQILHFNLLNHLELFSIIREMKRRYYCRDRVKLSFISLTLTALPLLKKVSKILKDLKENRISSA